MPRQARLESDTGYYHIMVRGINKNKVFESNLDKDILLNFIRKKTELEKCKVIAYCIMDNHFHLVISAKKRALATIMKRINGSFAMSYNKRYKRIGPVFQDRFRSENIHDEMYLYGVIRYVHNNPLVAGTVKNISNYKWSSINEYLTDELDIISKDMKDEILAGFTSAKDFKIFHLKEDLASYLELKENKHSQEDRAKEIIENYYKNNSITKLSDKNMRTELISEILSQTNLALRKIAQLTDSSYHSVYIINKNLEKF